MVLAGGDGGDGCMSQPAKPLFGTQDLGGDAEYFPVARPQGPRRVFNIGFRSLGAPAPHTPRVRGLPLPKLSAGGFGAANPGGLGSGSPARERQSVYAFFAANGLALVRSATPQRICLNEVARTPGGPPGTAGAGGTLLPLREINRSGAARASMPGRPVMMRFCDDARALPGSRRPQLD